VAIMMATLALQQIERNVLISNRDVLVDADVVTGHHAPGVHDGR
jgi:hypothetical protein